MPVVTRLLHTLHRFLWPLRRRVYAIALAYLVIVAILAGYGMAGAQRSAYLLERAGHSYQQLQTLHQLSGEIHHHFNRQLEALSLGEPTRALTESEARVQAGFDRLDRSIRSEIDLVHDPDEKQEEAAELAHLARMHDTLNRLLAQALEAYRFAPASEQAAAQLFFTRQVLSTFQERFLPLLEEAVAGEQEEVDEVEAEMGHLERRLHWLGLSGLGLGLMAALLLVVILSRSLIRPMGELIRATDALAEGRLDTRLPMLSGDEFAQLSRHFNDMGTRLHQQHRRLLQVNAELERRVAERTASLQDSNERLRQVDINRRRFLEDVSHELRSPVTILLGEAEVALRDPRADADSYRQALLTVQANAAFLRRRIEDLMALARVEDGRLHLEHQPLDLGALVEETARSLVSLARVNDLRLEWQRPPGRVPMLGDAGWLRQLLLTLLDNAIKFSRPDGVVRVGLQDTGEGLELWVEDQGIGVSSEQLPRLFERYYQADSGRQGRGFGLGLSIARWIVEQHEGAIEATSTPDKGVVIRARFPRRSVPA